MKVYKKLIFLTTYPPPLVNVVCERPLSVDYNGKIPVSVFSGTTTKISLSFLVIGVPTQGPLPPTRL